MLIPKKDFQEPCKDYYQSFAKRDLYSELICVSTPNRQKHWYFKVFLSFYYKKESQCIDKMHWLIIEGFTKLTSYKISMYLCAYLLIRLLVP